MCASIQLVIKQHKQACDETRRKFRTCIHIRIHIHENKHTHRKTQNENLGRRK